MATILFKWLLMAALGFAPAPGHVHPFYVSVVEIEHNAKAQTLEISCKIFTDDFEKALRMQYHTHVDLLDHDSKNAMNKLVSGYVLQHLAIRVEGKPVKMKYLGYEQVEECIYSYYEVAAIPSVKNITVTDNLLYEYKKEQENLLHVTVNGNRKSTKLNNPDSIAVLRF